jgi:integrase-like protein
VGYIEDLRGKTQGRGRPRWRARYRDPAGRERSKGFARKVDAEQFLVGVEDAKLRGAYVDPQLGRVVFGEWAERWYRTTADLKPSSRPTYRKLLDNQILPEFERATLAGIDTLAVREWIAGLVEQGLSPSRVRNAHQVLSQILAAGVEEAGSPATLRPESGCLASFAAKCIFLTARQVEDLAAVIDPRYGLLVRFAAYTGLRAGELVALRVRHLNLLRGRCEVGESATEVDGRLVWGRPRPTPAASCICLGSCATSPAPTLLNGRTARTVWCSPRRRVVRCVSRSSLPSCSSRQRSEQGSPAPAAVPRPAPHLREPAHRPGRQRQGDPGPARSCLRNRDPGPLRPPVPGRAAAARRAAPGGLRRRHCGPSTDRDLGGGRSRYAKEAGQRPASRGGGGETRTPVPQRRPRASPSAAAG